MESKAKRTLVKSAPELWELADDLPRLEAWMAGLMGTGRPVPVNVTRREPGRILVWRNTERDGEGTWIALELAEKGFGTSVSITARHSRPQPDDADAALEELLNELGSPERRPFERG
jgi:hypothetical protein